MALWTYAMLIAVATLLRSGPPGDPSKGGVAFKPDTIYNAVRLCVCVWWWWGGGGCRGECKGEGGWGG